MPELLELESPQIGERRDMSLKTEIRQSEKDEDVFTFIISREEEDRHESLVVVDGIDVSHFKNNPVVLFNHNYDRVIGKAFNINVVGNTLQAQMRFDTDEFSQEIKGKVERGMLNATSIGFIINEWTFEEDTDLFKIVRSELLEFSIVTVPSNRSALIMRDAQIDSLTKSVEKLTITVERLLKGNKEGDSDVTGLNRNDQANQLDPAETSNQDGDATLAELSEAGGSVPAEAEAVAEAEEDQSRDINQLTQVEFDELWKMTKSAVRRRLGKE